MTTFGRAENYIWEGIDYIWEGMRLRLGGYATTFGRVCDYVWEGMRLRLGGSYNYKKLVDDYL